MRPPRSKAAFHAALLLLALQSAASQEINAWFNQALEASAYAALRPAAEAFASRLQAIGLPDSLIADRLIEGARKRIPPPRLLAAIGDDTSRLESIAALLSKFSLKPEKPGDAAITAAASLLLLRSGATLTEFESALEAAARRIPPTAQESGQGARVDRALSAIATVHSIHARFPLAEIERRDLAAALVRSVLARRNFDSFLSIFTKYRAIGLATQRITAIIVESLSANGSLERIDRELQRRSSTQ